MKLFVLNEKKKLIINRPEAGKAAVFKLLCCSLIVSSLLQRDACDVRR